MKTGDVFECHKMAITMVLQAYVCLLLLPLVCGGSDVYVDPIASSCSDFNCTRDASALLVQNLTLDEALASISSHSTLHLRPGCHCIQSFNFVQNVSEVALVGEGPRSEVNITCAEGLGLAFYNLSTFSLRDITVDGCGLNGSNLSDFRHTVNRTIDLFFHIHSYYFIAVSVGGCVDLSVENVTVANSMGLGFLGINIVGTSFVRDSNFSNNGPPIPILPLGSLNLTQTDVAGGGALFLYHDYLDDAVFRGSVANLSIENSFFSGNLYPGFASVVGLYYQFSETVRDIGYVLGGGGGLTVTMTQLNYSVNANVNDCWFEENTARYGGGAHVEIFAGVGDSGVTFSDCHFERNGQNLSDIENILDTTTGAALVLFKDFVQPGLVESPQYAYVRRGTHNLILTHTTFRQNVAFTGGAVTVNSRYSPLLKRDSDIILFDSCTFEENIALLGAALFLKEEKRSGVQPGLYFLFENTSMTGNLVYVNNSAQIHSLDLADSSSVIDGNAINMTIKNSCFAGNTGTALRTLLSIVHLEGNVTFFNNTGTFGGALRLLSSSFLIVRNNSNITFQNNTAEIAGGAIFVAYLNNLPTVVYFDCFMFFDGLDLFCLGNISCVNITKTGARLNFIGNTAPFGSAVYGSTLETCPWGAEIRFTGNYSDLTLFEILYKDYRDVFNFDTEPNTTKQVSTDSNTVEISSGQQSPVNVTPGEEFFVDVVTLDRFSREIPSVLSSKINSANTHVTSTLGLSGYWFTATNSQTPVTVYGEASTSNFTVTLFTTDSFAQTDITVNLIDCTPAFIFDNDTFSCVCDPRIQRKGYVSCNSTSKELTVDSIVWVGPGPHGQGVVGTTCILDYCEPGTRTFRPPDFDVQCHSEYNRTGIACGECEEGYSAAFGTNRCMKCSNSNLFWIPILAVLGLGIIFLICYLRISISDGFFLSVLFYVNIVSLYTSSFTAGQQDEGANAFIVTSWLNLDLGITSCFYDGMDAVARTGLQLVFPAYLYLLMFLIIILARKSPRFCNVFSRGGYSASKLFATLMLMTHTNLTRTCIEILGITQFEKASGELLSRWQADPNVSYFAPTRVPLVIIAILLLLFYIIPAPLLLIFPNFGRKLRILQRFTPIYDAFWAPFKPRYRFWVGVRLLLRGFPILFAFFATHPTNVVLLGVFLMILTYVQFLVWPFKKTLLNALDMFFQYNILLLVVLTLYFTVFLTNASDSTVHRFTRTQFITFGVIVFSAYLVMEGMFVRHLLIRFPRLKTLLEKLWQKLCCRVQLTSKSGSISISFSRRSSSQTYGAIAQGHSSVNMSEDNSHMTSNESEQDGVHVQFSELREPLLEEGELSIEDVTPGSKTCK